MKLRRQTLLVLAAVVLLVILAVVYVLRDSGETEAAPGDPMYQAPRKGMLLPAPPDPQ